MSVEITKNFNYFLRSCIVLCNFFLYLGIGGEDIVNDITSAV